MSLFDNSSVYLQKLVNNKDPKSYFESKGMRKDSEFGWIYDDRFSVAVQKAWIVYHLDCYMISMSANSTIGYMQLLKWLRKEIHGLNPI